MTAPEAYSRLRRAITPRIVRNPVWVGSLEQPTSFAREHGPAAICPGVSAINGVRVDANNRAEHGGEYDCIQRGRIADAGTSVLRRAHRRFPRRAVLVGGVIKAALGWWWRSTDLIARSCSSSTGSRKGARRGP